MLELIDVVSRSGFRTGEVLSREEVHRLGKIHRAVHLYLFNRNEDLLLQRRSMNVDHYPGMLSISVVGHVGSGETSTRAVRREIQEELGVEPAGWSIEFLFSFYREARIRADYVDRHLIDVFVAREDISLGDFELLKQEVAGAEFVSMERFQEMVGRKTGALAPVYSRECDELLRFLGELR